jgi:hypothetical protein
MEVSIREVGAPTVMSDPPFSCDSQREGGVLRKLRDGEKEKRIDGQRDRRPQKTR